MSARHGVLADDTDARLGRRPRLGHSFYKYIYSEPEPLRVDGNEYRRRTKRRSRP